MQSIKVRHTIQMAHRLWKLPGKCQNIHGHTWTVFLEIQGQVDDNGVLLDYHEVKKAFRDMLDTCYDHRLCLDCYDPLIEGQENSDTIYPGVILRVGQPTVENLAKAFGSWARDYWGLEYMYQVELWEGDNNAATWSG